MIFSVQRNMSGEILIMINNKSCVLWMINEGVSLSSTSYPQVGVDYAPNRRVKIVGIDMA